MNWEVILWACGTVAVLLILAMLVLSILSARNMRRSREHMAQLQSDIKVGASILFGGGIYGKIVKIKDDVIDVEVGKDTVIQISRYAIQSVE
ncbi:MAG TPA: preprotein translocase subunit YajC [Candidatus Agathobaculum intestinipullorum]|nr:preprotein translocase subunit YajC [Candidatus Agathobaculum intestinipullorum]